MYMKISQGLFQHPVISVKCFKRIDLDLFVWIVPHEKECPEGYISVRHPEFNDCHSYVRMNICFTTHY